MEVARDSQEGAEGNTKVEEQDQVDTRGSTRSDGNIGRDNGGSSQVVEEAVAAAGRGHGQGFEAAAENSKAAAVEEIGWRTRLPFEAVARTKMVLFVDAR
jgi:hypothetical protein